MSNFLYTPEMLVGMFDADGTFTIRIRKKEDNRLGFSVLASITQATANKEVLTVAKDQFFPKASLVSFTTKPKDGSKLKKMSRLDVTLTTPGGKTFQKIFTEVNPKSPSKYRDYLIALQVLAFINVFMPVKNQRPGDASEEKVHAIATVYIIYQNVNEAKRPDAPRKRRKPMEYWINLVKPTPEEREQGLKLGASFLKEIENKEASWKQELTDPRYSLPKDYMVGFLIGDGSLQVQSNIPETCDRLDLTPEFSAKECSYGRDLLVSFKNTLDGAGEIKDLGNQSIYRLRGWPSNYELIVPFLKPYTFPRQKQVAVDAFIYACEENVTGSFRTSFAKLKALAEATWHMNGEAANRKLTLEEFLARAKKFFERRRRPT